MYMYYCQSCQKLMPAGTPSARVAIQTRQIRHPARTFRRRRGEKLRDDRGGVGTQIAVELICCPTCARADSSGLGTREGG